MAKILIAVPTFENIEPDCFKSIFGLHRPFSHWIQFDYVRGYDCAIARNRIVKEAFQYNFDYVLMLDSDNTLPNDALIKMLDANQDIVLGWCQRKAAPAGQTAIYKLNDDRNFTPETSFGANDMRDELIECKGGGMCCSLIKTDVFRRMGNCRWFRYLEYDNGSFLSEDLYFCDRARHEFGYKIFVHGGVRCGHVVKVVL
jgi:glycosyltransferase involved in cell wall biosynthesis